MSPTYVPHSSSHNLESLDDDLEILESVDPLILDMTRRTPVKAGVLPSFSPVSEEAKRLFRSKPSFNQRSIITADSPEFAALQEYCGTDGVYSLHLPGERDRIWHMPQKGWQAIPLLFFELGFRLPMHPLFSALLELLGCGVAQLAPNAVVQVCGVIAQSFEKKKVPTVDLLLSIYRVKYAGGQFYLDKKLGRVRLVDVRSSNTGWHGKWAYYAGGELGLVSPWSDISKDWLHELNHLPGLPEAVLTSFLERKKMFSSEEFTKNDFLISHCCKKLCLLDVLCFCFLFLKNFWCLLFVTVTGEPLRVLLKSPRKMLSAAMLSMIAKRGASSMAGRGIEYSREKDFEETSKPQGEPVDASGSLELLGEVSGAGRDSVATRTSDRKRIRKAEEESLKPPLKKTKYVIKLRGLGAEGVDSPGKEVVGLLGDEPGRRDVDEVFSATRAASSAKILLDQVCLYPFCWDFFLGIIALY